MLVTVSTKKLVCPICKDGANIDGFKVNDRGVWWHRCLNKEHGFYVLPNGKEFKFPDYPYFHDSIVSTKHGELSLVPIKD